MATKKEGGLLSKVPLPDTFFSIKHQLRPIASLSVSAPSAILIYLLTIGGFVGCWIVYSAPGPSLTTTVTQQEWQKVGYECSPLQAESWYKKTWSYDDCLENIREPNTESVVLKNNKWFYYPIQGEEITVKGSSSWNSNSLKQGAYASSIGFGNSDFNWGGTGIANFGGGYGCQCANDQPAMINLYKEFLAESPLCLPFKENAPFKCTKTEVTYKSELEKLSLSIANTQLLFGVLTAFFAFMFYKCKKNEKIKSDDGKPWMDEIHRLREELRDGLRQKVDKSDKQVV